jgi:8-oxo-dGTP diphosphatase
MTPPADLIIRPGIAAVVQNVHHHILLHRRHVGRGWAPPSGALEPGEDLHAGLHRELREETGLSVTVERLVGIYSDPTFQIVQYPDGRTVHFVTCLFVCRVQAGMLQGSAEGTAWAWFSPHALPEDLLPYAQVWLRDALRGPAPVVVR